MIERRLLLLSAAALLAACSSPPPAKTKAPEKPAEPVTGRFAFYQMFPSARAWAPDAQGLRVRSIRIAGVPDKPGASGAWEAVFVSPSRGKARAFTYSAVEGEGNLHEGVFGNIEENWGGPRPQAQPWIVQAFKVDSDAAYEAALKKSAEYVKAFPDKPVSFLLEQTDRHPFVTWRVIWGESVGTSDYSIFVSGSTGEYLEKMR